MADFSSLLHTLIGIGLYCFDCQDSMGGPSLLSQCLPGWVLHERSSHNISTVSERDICLPSPAVQIIPSKTAYPYKYAGDNVDLQGLYVFKGRISVADIIGFGASELGSSKPDGSFKSWENSLDLVNVLKNEIRDGQLSFRGKRVLELSCGYGLPGIFAFLKGASTVHFQDQNSETIRCTTIPNVLANLEEARDRQSRQPESPLTPSRQTLSPTVHFYAGDYEELPTVLSVVKNEMASASANLSFCEDDFMDGCSSHDGSITTLTECPSKRSRKLSGSQAWEMGNETDQGGGYDAILLTEIPYSVPALKKLYALIKKCARPPYGVIYLAAKKNHVGFNNGARHLRNLVDEEGIFAAHLIKEMNDRDMWKFFFK